MKGFSYKRRKCFDSKNHRKYLAELRLSRIMSEIFVRESEAIKKAIEKAALYGTGERKTEALKANDTFTCRVAVPDAILKQLLGDNHA